MKYSQPELLFHPIYSDQVLLNIPPPTHKPLLQYSVSYPSLNVNTIISNITRNPHHSSTYLEESNELKYYSDHEKFSPSLIPSSPPSLSTLSTLSLKHHIIETTTISKQYPFDTNKASGRILDSINTTQYILASRPIIPHYLYH